MPDSDLGRGSAFLCYSSFETELRKEQGTGEEPQIDSCTSLAYTPRMSEQGERTGRELMTGGGEKKINERREE